MTIKTNNSCEKEPMISSRCITTQWREDRPEDKEGRLAMCRLGRLGTLPEGVQQLRPEVDLGGLISMHLIVFN